MPIMSDHQHFTVDPPDDITAITVTLPDGSQQTIDVADLAQMKRSAVSYSFVTDHGVHGPYRLGGVALSDLLTAVLPADMEFGRVSVISADDFATTFDKDDLRPNDTPMLLCDSSDDQQLTRQRGLIRLVVPADHDDALRQIKWVRTIAIT